MADRLVSGKIAEMRGRLQELQAPALGPPTELNEAFEELQVSLEEIYVAQEELEERTEALAEANRDLEEERRRYRGLFDLTPGGCAVTSVEGIIREANFGLAALLNVPLERLVGKPISLYVGEADKRAVRTWLASFAGENAPATRASDVATKPGTREIELQPRSRAPFPALVTVAPIRTTGGILQGFRWLCQDITERKRAEAERQAWDIKLQGTQRLEGLAVLAGGVAHDFNNLLTNVLGNADLALAGVPTTSSARVQLDAIIVAAQRAADLSNQLLAFSGKGKFVVEPVHLQQFVLETQPLLETVVSSRCRIEYDLSPAAVIEADVTQLRQIVTNLILNASEATGEHGGTIALRIGTRECTGSDLTQVRIGTRPSARHVCFRRGGGHRLWDDARDAGTDLRAVLLHQAQRARARTRGRPWNRARPLRRRGCREHPRSRDHNPGLLPRDPGLPGGPHISAAHCCAHHRVGNGLGGG